MDLQAETPALPVSNNSDEDNLSTMTIIEKIIAAHAGKDKVKPGDAVWLEVDYRSARDFGGPNVVKQLRTHFPENPLESPDKTFFPFDTNAPANTTGYANNQHRCRIFAREYGAGLFDVDSGIGTHVAFENGLVKPGNTAVGTDSHFNILGAIGAFGQGMGDVDIAYIFRSGRTWFDVPSSIKVELSGVPAENVHAKDIAIYLLKVLGTTEALGKAVEIYGPAVDNLDLAGRITLCSLATEAGAIAFLLPPSESVSGYYREKHQTEVTQPMADQDADYDKIYRYDISNLSPYISPPPTPNGGKPVSEVENVKVDSVFVGSCTNGRYKDFRAVADVLKGKKVAKGVMLKMVPATREVFMQILQDGTLADLANAGAIMSQPGCGGCASGQIGMTGEHEVQLSTSNRNFAGKQGLGETYLASPRTAAWTALRGVICNED